MDGWEIFASLTGSAGLCIGIAHWLTQRLINHRLEKELKTYQSGIDKDLKDHQAAIDKELKNYQSRIDKELQEARTQSDKELKDYQAVIDKQLSTTKSEVDAKLRQDVDEYLGEKSAERQYQLDARKRLYSAIGPLRFQLVMACMDFSNRIAGIGGGHASHPLTLKGYYGRSTLYRLLRLLALTELIERQMAHADFSVDPSVRTLLRFRQLVFRCLSDQLVPDDPTKWDQQEQHLFKDTLLILGSAAIIVEPSGLQRVIRFDELNAYVADPTYLDTIQPLPRMIEGFMPDVWPLLWLRFLALTEVCMAFARLEGPPVGLDPEAFDTTALIDQTKDDDVLLRRDDYAAALRKFSSSFTSLQSPSP